MFYIDTSVLVAYYCPEAASRKVQERLAKADQPVISPLVELEMYSAMAAKVRANELDSTSAGLILGQFRKQMEEGWFGIVPIETAQYAQAREWIGRFSSPLRAPDALHLAAASANSLTLLTADKALAESAKQFGVAVELIS